MYSTSLRNSSLGPVLDQFRIDILMNRYRDNEKVTEIGLAEHYGVTRNTIRSVLPLLEAEGLIRTLDNGAKCVVPVTLQDVNNLYDMRSYIEVNAARTILAMETFDKMPLLTALSRLAESLKTDDIRTIQKEDGAFHQTIIDLSGNKVFSQAYSAFKGLEVSFFELNMNLTPNHKEEYLAKLIGRHSDLAFALLTGREDAPVLFEEHVEDGRIKSLNVMARVLKGEIMSPAIAL